jgi:zinc transport system permease protein
MTTYDVIIVGAGAGGGVAAGVLADVWPGWTAQAVAVLGALGVEWLRSRGSAQGDLALATFFYGGIAGGVVLAGQAGALNANLFSYLFGSILTVDRGEVAVIAALGVVIVVTVAVCGRALFAMAVDEEWSTVAGVPVRALNAVLAVLVAVGAFAVLALGDAVLSGSRTVG